MKNSLETKQKQKKGALNLDIEARTDDRKVEQEEMDAKIAKKMQNEIDQVIMKLKDKPSRSRPKRDFFRAQSNTLHTPSSNNEVKLLRKTNSTRRQSSQGSYSATVQTCTKDPDRKLSTPPSKQTRYMNKGGIRKKASPLVETSSICDHFHSASSSKQMSSRQKNNKRPRPGEYLKDVRKPQNGNASNNLKGKKNVVYVNPPSDMSSSQSDSSSSSSSSSVDSMVGGKRKFNACVKKRKHNPMRNGSAGNSQIDLNFSIDTLESPDVINISDSETVGRRVSRRCKRGGANTLRVSTDQIDDATIDPPSFTSSTGPEIRVSDEHFSTSSSTSCPSATPLHIPLQQNDEVIRIKPSRNTRLDMENIPPDTGEEDEIGALTHTSEVKPVNPRGHHPVLAQKPVSIQDNYVLEVDNSVLVRLIKMGFRPARCRSVLRDANNDIELAVSMMVSEGFGMND